MFISSGCYGNKNWFILMGWNLGYLRLWWYVLYKKNKVYFYVIIYVINCIIEIFFKFFELCYVLYIWIYIIYIYVYL